jgi:predicted amidohydrolase YtcJ
MVLSAAPMAVEPMKIREIQVLETLKEGSSIYRRA